MRDVPVGWGDLLFRAVTTAAIAFLILQAKELHDAGAFDTPGTAADAGLIAGGIVLVNAVFKWVESRAR